MENKIVEKQENPSAYREPQQRCPSPVYDMKIRRKNNNRIVWWLSLRREKEINHQSILKWRMLTNTL
ncbi:MAG: hypothetical protein MJE68_28670 [Proteobacteria bacterium]|nr:hypothetical protein [Pseudomonadota bacterium]